MSTPPIPGPDSDGNPVGADHGATSTIPSAGGTPKRSPWKGLIVIAVLLGALAIVYAANPKARSYAVNTIEAIRSKSGELLDKKPERDFDLLAHAAVSFRQQNWEEAAKAYGEFVELEPENYKVWGSLAQSRHSLKDYEGAIEANLQAVKLPGQAPTVYYNLACEYALIGDKDRAFAALDNAFRHGFQNISLAQTDPDFDSLRDDERFELPPAPQQMSFTCKDGTSIDYWLVLPRDFDPEKTYPCLLGMNGGNQGLGIGRNGLRNFWGLQAYYHGWIVFTPAAPPNKAYYFGDGHLLIEELLDFIQSTYHIEGGRFHVAGYSNGGTSAFRIATEFPERFHSVTGFPGYPTPGEMQERVERLRNMKITMFWGSRDQGPSKTQSLKTHELLKNLGIDPTIREYEGENHIPSSLLGDVFMTYLDTLR